MPAVWASRWPTVTREACSAPPKRKSGRYSVTGSSRPSRPSWARTSTLLAAAGLAAEPHRNGVSAVTGSPRPSIPQARRWTGPSAAALSASVIATELAAVFTGECRQYAERPASGL